MSPYYSDTHPKMEALQIELIRQMPSWKKFAAVNDLNEAVRKLALIGIHQRHPGATPEQVRRLLADLLLGEDLARKVYGDLQYAVWSNPGYAQGDRRAGKPRRSVFDWRVAGKRLQIPFFSHSPNSIPCARGSSFE
jgi:hypothetical protein